MNLLAAKGNLVGPQSFKAEQAPKYTSGVAAMLSCYAVALVLIAVVSHLEKAVIGVTA